MVRQRPVERVACGLPPAPRYLSRDDAQLVRVETDALEPEGIHRGDWLVLDGDETVGVIRGASQRKEPKP